METAVFPGKYEILADIGKFVARAADQAGLDSQAAYAVQVAVDEACTNIIEHAYGGEGKGTITCSVEAATGGLTVILKDTGRPFHPEKIRAPDLKSPLSKRKEGGLGMFFIRQYMDEVQYDFSNEGENRLTMIKRRSPIH